MATIDKSRLSEGMKNDLLDYQKTKEDSIYWIGTLQPKTTDQLITRFQSSKIIDVVLSGLKTAADWRLSNSPLTEVRSSTPAISINNKYSSYALKENIESMGNLRYPLSNSFAGKNILFTKKDFPAYEELVQKIKNAYKIKIVEQTNKDKLFTYKKPSKFSGFLKNTAIGIVNLCRTIFKKDKFKVEPSYKGKMIINNNFTYKNGASYQISQHEKLTRILDGILGITVENQAKVNKIKLSKNELFASRLFAEILLARAINYGDLESNIKVETSLTLQFSNVLATLDLSAEKLGKVSKVGMESAKNAISKLGLTLENVKLSVLNAGYLYHSEPKTIEEALLPKGGLVKELTPTEEVKENSVEEVKEVEQVTEVIEQDKFTDKKPLEGVKNTKVMLTLTSAKKYIDNVIENTFKKLINASISQISENQLKGGRKEKRLERQYNFVEHMLAYYNKNKDVSQEELLQQIDKELQSLIVDDNKYAHSFGQSFVDLRNHLLEEIFKGEVSIEKIDGKGIATVINEFVEEKYGKKLSTYASESLKKTLVPMFKEIDSKQFTPKNITEEKSKEEKLTTM